MRNVCSVQNILHKLLCMITISLQQTQVRAYIKKKLNAKESRKLYVTQGSIEDIWNVSSSHAGMDSRRRQASQDPKTSRLKSTGNISGMWYGLGRRIRGESNLFGFAKMNNSFCQTCFFPQCSNQKRKCNPYGLDALMPNYEELQDIF